MASSSNRTMNDDGALRAQMMADIGLQRRIAITQAHDEDDRIIQDVEQEEAALQRQRKTFAPGDPRAAHLAAWNKFKENDPHVDIEARKLPTITAGGVTHRLNRGGNLATPEPSAAGHGIDPPVAPTQPVPALDPRGGGRPSRSITLLSNALAKLSIDRHEPTAAQPVAKPDLVSPDAFMTAVKSIFGVPNPTAATAASTINPIGSPSPPVKGPSPASSPELKRASKPDRGRRVFEERLLGLQASKYAPKIVAVDIDVVMGEAGDDVPDVPEPKEVPKLKEVPKPKEVSHARPLGLMASKWAPKK